MTFEGFVFSNPLRIAEAVNTKGYGAIVPDIATHISVWYARSFDGRVSLPVAMYLLNEKGYTKQYDLALQHLEIVSKLGVHGVHIAAVTQDQHRSNVVRTCELLVRS